LPKNADIFEIQKENKEIFLNSGCSNHWYMAAGVYTSGSFTFTFLQHLLLAAAIR